MSTFLSTRVAPGQRPGRDIFRTLVEEMDDLFGRFNAEISGDRQPGMLVPSMDVSEVDNSLQVRMDLPGVKAEDVNIEIVGDQIRIRGERKEETEEKGKTFHRIERRSGTFYRAATLPCAVDQEKAEAEYANGVLTITIPKSPETQAKQVKIKAK